MPPYSSGIVTPNRPSSFICSTIGSGELVLVVVVLGVGQDLLVGELVHHLGDRLLLVGLLGVRAAATAML